MLTVIAHSKNLKVYFIFCSLASDILQHALLYVVVSVAHALQTRFLNFLCQTVSIILLNAFHLNLGRRTVELQIYFTIPRLLSNKENSFQTEEQRERIQQINRLVISLEKVSEKTSEKKRSFKKTHR